jgi:hypothetical protein
MPRILESQQFVAHAVKIVLIDFVATFVDSLGRLNAIFDEIGKSQV